MGLLTKIFGNPDGGLSAGESSTPDQTAGAIPALASSGGAADADKGGPAKGAPAKNPSVKVDPGSSGIRPAVETPNLRNREPQRPTGANRRPEHPRMYLRPTPVSLDPAVPGSTRRQPISVRPSAKDGRPSSGAITQKPGRSEPSAASRAEPGGATARTRRDTPSAPASSEPPRSESSPSEPPPSSHTPRPPSSHPRPVMVVSPVSLTPEEVQLPPGERQKQPTLLGLGTAIGVLALSEYEDVDPEFDELETPVSSNTESGAASSGSVTSSAAQFTPVRSLVGPAQDPGTGDSSPGSESEAAAEPEVDATPAEVSASVERLADFALKLSLGPVSRLWVPEVRRSAEVLLAAGKQRKAPTLTLVSQRLLGLLSNQTAPANPAVAAEALATDAPAAAEALATDAPAAAEAAQGPSSADAASGAVVADVSVMAGSSVAASEVAASEVAASEVAASESLADGAATAPDPGEPAASVQDEPSLAAPVESNSPESNSPEPAVEVEALMGAVREQVLHEVTRLAGLLPEWPEAVQDLAEETRRREMRLVRELLEAVDGLRRDQRARLTEQMRLEELSTLTPEALAEEFETPKERAEELSNVLTSYRQLRQRCEPDVGNVRGCAHALAELERAQREFEQGDPERKDEQRALRAARRKAMTALALQLAERGELEQLELIEPLCVAERIERLRQWLDAVERPS